MNTTEHKPHNSQSLKGKEGCSLYPLKFKPILKSLIWGGSDICKFKKISPVQEGIGESWEISGVEGNISVIDNGELAGKPIDEVLRIFKEQLVGKKVYDRFGDTFPLLIKFIDARDDLSIQVHPNDELAMKRHNSFGKTEMWYVINATSDAYLYSGFSSRITPDEYVETVANNTFTDKLQKYEVKPGDVFFLPAGRVHAIGAGCFIAEIQQTSNITYRIYDYNRKDAEGNTRELHTELAKDAIDYRLFNDYRTQYTAAPNQPVQLASCEYFTTTLLEIDRPIERNYEEIDSFVIYICIQGDCMLKDNKGNSLTVEQGESVLIPADIGSLHIIPGKNSKLLETFVE